jgi:hypothetical protein
MGSFMRCNRQALLPFPCSFFVAIKDSALKIRALYCNWERMQVGGPMLCTDIGHNLIIIITITPQ